MLLQLRRGLRSSALTLLALTGSTLAQEEAFLPARPVVGSGASLRIRPRLRDVVDLRGSYFWSELVQASRASFVKLHFTNVHLRPGDVLTLRSMRGEVVERITGRGPKDAGTFWSLSAFGDGLQLEFSFASLYDHVPFRIDRAIYGHEGLFEGASENLLRTVCSPADYEDVLCYQSDAAKWSNVLASVGVMTVGSNAQTGLWCSGSNVSPLNYILTNEHCIANQADCDNSEFVFRFYRTDCNSGAAPNMDWVSFRCEDLVASSPFISCEHGLTDLDFALCTVLGDPASQFGFVEIDPTPLVDGEAVYMVQHPNGRPHEITHGSGVNVDVDGHVLRYYDTLDSESGSSGSPIFRESDDKLVALHHCGGCSSPGVGNRGVLMSDVHPLIESFLCSGSVDLLSSQPGPLSQVSGNGNPIMDPGEVWEFTPALRNSACSEVALGVSADFQIGAGSAPITLLQSSASFGDVAPSSAALSISPIQFMIDPAAACGSTVVIDIVQLLATNGGPFAGESAVLTAQVGQEVLEVELSAGFNTGLGIWQVIDQGANMGATATWSDGNPGARSLSLTEPFMICDSQKNGLHVMDEELISPVLDLGCAQEVTLRYTHDFKYGLAGMMEQADVDVRSSATAGAWVNVANYAGADAAGMMEHDITTWAAGQSDVQVRFHYYDAALDQWWAVDDVFVIASEGFLCTPAPGPNPGVPWRDVAPTEVGPCD